jgi:hypothetical protein
MRGLALTFAVATAATAGVEPCLVFAPADLPALRQRLQQADVRGLWDDLRAQADDLCTPRSRRYADPEAIDAPRAGVRIQVLAHSFGRALTEACQTLGFAFQMTGESRYGSHGSAILAAAARKLPASDERIARSFAGARGDVMRGFAMGLDWLGEAMPEDQRRAVEETAAEYVRVILKERHAQGTRWVPHHNFMGVSLGAAGCLALRLRERFPDEAPGWTSQCADGIRLWLDRGFDEQGAYVEGIGYAQYGLANAVLFAHALKRQGGPDLFDHPRLCRVPRFFAQSLLPGETVFEARNDANYAGLGDPFMLRLATACDSSLAAWLWQRCGSGRSPLALAWQSALPGLDPVSAGVPLAEHFAGRGLCVFRTGWAEDDVMFSVEAGPYYAVTHNQADKGHFTLYGLGRRWAIDSGYGNNRQPGGRDQTVAHNAVLVDGVGQALSGAGAGTSGRILSFADSARCGHVLCDAADAYNRNDKAQPGATVRQALRHSLFIRPSQGSPAYAMVFDDIRKDDQPHEYAWLLHTDTDNEVRLDAAGATLVPATASGGAYVETPAGATGQGRCEWRFQVPEPGEYVLWARVRAGGPEVAKSDSFFVQMDDARPIEWHMPGTRPWTWGRVAHGLDQVPAAFALPAGEHRLCFLTREAGAQLDAVVLTTDATLTPPVTVPGSALRLEAEAAHVTAPMRVVPDPAAGTPRLRVLLAAAAPLRYEVDTYDGHPRLRATASAVAPEFAAVLLPLPGTCPEPAVRFEQTPGGLAIAVQWQVHTDHILWPAGGARQPRLLGE